MNQEVFPLIAKMGLGIKDEMDPLKQEKRRSKRSRRDIAVTGVLVQPDSVTAKSLISEVHPKEASATLVPSGALNDGLLTAEGNEAHSTTITTRNETMEVSALQFYGPLYPSYLLMSIRLLDRGFEQPSPLALSVLPKIKSLGPISQVLGASTALYNELLRVYWYRYDNFQKVLKLLTEMERSGLDFGKETLEVIQDIIGLQSKIARGERGKTLRLLWSLPEFAPNRFRAWKEQVEAAIGEGAREVDSRLLLY